MKRKCGTCKFFEDKGMAGSGTCLQPTRRELRAVVLVRQTELACRNSYDQDLWEQSDNPVLSGPDEASSGGVIPDPDLIYDLPAADRDVTFGLSEAAKSNADDRSTDRVTDVRMPGQIRPSFPQNQPAFVQSSQPHILDDQTNAKKSAVQSARWRREQDRRDQNQRILEQQIQDVEAHMSSSAPLESRIAGLPGDSSLRKMDPVFSSMKTAGRHEVPDEEFEPTVRPHHRVRKAPVQDDRQRMSGLVRLGGEPAQFGDVTTDSARTQPRVDEQGTEPLPTEDVRALINPARIDGRTSPRDHVSGEAPQRMSQPVAHVGGPLRTSTAGWSDKQPVMQLQTAEPLDPVDRVERLATLKRCCATCRDYRQVGNDNRGWCSNPYAFSQRRMVESDQLACRSSLGMWWMPNDDLWLERADTSHHGRPTPLLDASLMAQRPAETGRDSRASRPTRRE